MIFLCKLFLPFKINMRTGKFSIHKIKKKGTETKSLTTMFSKIDTINLSFPKFLLTKKICILKKIFLKIIIIVNKYNKYNNNNRLLIKNNLDSKNCKLSPPKPAKKFIIF